VRSSFAAAALGVTDIDPAVLDLEGMSGKRYRMFINNLIRGMSDPRYLEIGTWAGSTLCSAINRNAVKATAIDNWSQFGGPKELFEHNLSLYRNQHTDVRFIESDFRQVDYRSLGMFNVYLFDGPHAEKDQYDGIDLAKPALDNTFVLIIDDWNWEPVRHGTAKALAQLNFSTLYSIEVRTTLDNSHPAVGMQSSDWHNGYFIGVIQK
jgi:hypothetical protein